MYLFLVYINVLFQTLFIYLDLGYNHKTHQKERCFCHEFFFYSLIVFGFIIQCPLIIFFLKKNKLKKSFFNSNFDNFLKF